MLIINICTYDGFSLCLTKYTQVCLFQQYLHVKTSNQRKLRNLILSSIARMMNCTQGIKQRLSFVLSNLSEEESAAKSCLPSSQIFFYIFCVHQATRYGLAPNLLAGLQRGLWNLIEGRIYLQFLFNSWVFTVY